jgi:hypothetical protein
MANSEVPITPGTGSEIAVYTDTGSVNHQRVVIETQSGTADPVSVGASNPLPVTGTVGVSGVVSVAENVEDGEAFTRGVNAALPVMGVAETSNPTLTANKAATLSMDLSGNLRTKDANGGNAATGVTIPTGGLGILGWLSGIYNSLFGGILGVHNTTAPTLTNGQVGPIQLDASGNLMTNLSAGGAAAGTAGNPSADVMTIQGGPGMTPVQVSQPLTTTGGASYSNEIAPATPAAVAVKTSAGNIYGVTAMNLGTTPVYIKFWDTTTAPTLGSTAANYQFMVPGNTGGAGVVIQFNFPRSHANRIYYAVTGAISLTDDTSITGSSVVVDVAYN